MYIYENTILIPIDRTNKKCFVNRASKTYLAFWVSCASLKPCLYSLLPLATFISHTLTVIVKLRFSLNKSNLKVKSFFLEMQFYTAVERAAVPRRCLEHQQHRGRIWQTPLQCTVRYWRLLRVTNQRLQRRRVHQSQGNQLFGLKHSTHDISSV